MSPIAAIIQIICYALIVAILVRVAFSWFPASARGSLYRVYRLSYDLTEPVLGPVRRLLPSTAGLDLSPMIVTFVLLFISSFITRY